MKLSFTFLLLFLFTTLTFSQEGKSVTILPKWKKGDQFSFNIKKIKIQDKKNGQKQKDSAVFIGKIKVLEITDSAIQNSYQTNYSFISQFGLGNEYFKNVDLNKSLEIIYSCDHEGAFEKIENWDAVEKELSLAFKALIDSFKKDKTYSAEYISSFEKVLNVMKSQNFVEKNIYSELQLIHFLMGIELSNKQEINYEEELQNQFGSDPLRSEATLKVENIDFKNGEITVSQEKNLNNEDVNKFITSFFKKMNIKDTDFGQALKDSKYKISDQTHFLINYKIGIPEKITYKRSSEVFIANENGSRFDEVLIERIK